MEMRNDESVVLILDEYDCVVLPDRLRINIDSPRDASLSDIMSELYRSGGIVYFDGVYYEHNGEYRVEPNHLDKGWHLDLFY